MSRLVRKGYLAKVINFFVFGLLAGSFSAFMSVKCVADHRGLNNGLYSYCPEVAGARAEQRR